MRRSEWKAMQEESEMRRARALILSLPYQQRVFWIRKLDAEGFDAVRAFTSWLAKGDHDVPTS